MDPFVQKLHDRLENEQMRLHLQEIWQNAIRELHDSGVPLSAVGRCAWLIRDPDGEVRRQEKIELAKSIGRQWIRSTMPVPTETGLAFLATVDYDSRFVHSMLLCFLEWIEDWHRTMACDPPVPMAQYIVHVISGQEDLTELTQHLQWLDQVYPQIRIVLMRDGRILYPPEQVSQEPQPLVPKVVSPLRDLADRWRCSCTLTHAGNVHRCSCGRWHCTCGKLHAGYVRRCTCGTNKRDLGA